MSDIATFGSFLRYETNKFYISFLNPYFLKNKVKIVEAAQAGLSSYSIDISIRSLNDDEQTEIFKRFKSYEFSPFPKPYVIDGVNVSAGINSKEQLVIKFSW